jgi:UDP-N-acetylmuramoyl-tripeptide--D-alanyl-D-alanine ligase
VIGAGGTVPVRSRRPSVNSGVADTAATIRPMPTPQHLARLFGGRLEVSGAVGSPPISAVVTDSRQAGPATAFVAVPGEVDDGHRFIADAAARGAPLAVVGEAWRAPGDEPVPPLLLRVADTALALRRACRERLEELQCRVAGITGSVGKTTAKEMTAHILGEGAARTPGNLNTWTGVPCAVLSLEGEPDVLVAEMAMSAAGEIADLAAMTRPQVGVLLNIGVSHIELLGSVDAIADAKAELLEALPLDGVAILNADDPQVVRVAARTRARVWWYGLGEAIEEPAVRAHAVEPHGLRGTDFLLTTWKGEWARVSLSVPGAHLVSTACAAAAVGTWFGVPLQEIAERLSTYRSPEQRGRLLAGAHGAAIYDDSYNSAPVSLEAALDVLLASGSPRRIAVVGDMLELGDLALAAHDDAGRRIALAATDAVLVGDHAGRMATAAVAAGMAAERVHVAADAEDAARITEPLCDVDTTVLVKASHGLHLERTVALLVAGSPVSEAS